MRFSKAVVKYRVPILIAALLLMIPSVMGMAGTRINYDMLDYLPEDMDTVIGQNELLEEFHKGAFSFLILEHQSRIPKRRASMAICILNSPSARMDTPAAMQIKSITPLVRSSTITPRAMSRMPNSRSYWNASRYRSLEKYPTSFTTPKAAIAAPSTRPIDDVSDYFRRIRQLRLGLPEK